MLKMATSDNISLTKMATSDHIYLSNNAIFIITVLVSLVNINFETDTIGMVIPLFTSICVKKVLCILRCY